MKPTLSIIYILLITGQHLMAQSSVLSQGTWRRLAVVEKGVYRIDPTDLVTMGFDLGGIDPLTIQIYGSGGGMLPQSNSVERPLGLSEKAIYVHGEEDGNLDQGDYILFFAQGPDELTFNTSNGEITYQKNLYADSAYYFLTAGQREGKRIETVVAEAHNTTRIGSFPQFITHEIDETNIISSGRNWVGESFSSGGNGTNIFIVPTPGRIDGTVRLISQVVGRSPDGGNFSLNLNGSQPIGEQMIPSYPDATYGDKGQFVKSQFEINVNQGNELQLTYTYTSSGIGHLDYFVIQYDRALRLDEEPLFFRNQSDFVGASTFEIENASDQTIVWDITSPQSPIGLPVDINSNTAIVTRTLAPDQELVVFNADQAKRPFDEGPVANQDLLGSNTPEALFIAHPLFLDQAQRLADFRRSNDGLDVLVVSTNQVYNEFSSGRQDISAIRDFVKHLYDKSAERLKYLLLFGDGSFDYKDRTIVDHNFVPVYQSRNSTHRIYSYSSDDYYGFLEPEEGFWSEEEQGVGGDHTLEIGIGRLPVKSREEAEQVVTKLIRYQTSANRLGDWRSKIYFLADDGDFNIHLKDAEGLASFVDTAYNYFDLNKIYVDAYRQEQSGGNETVPEATRAVENIFDEGALIVNFTGHGNEGQWTEEDLLVESMIPQFKNRVKLPLLVTATCEFGAYDNPLRLSGGEQMLLNPEGGAIALLTTTRPVFAHTNRPVNEAFYRNAFELIDGQQPRLGDIIRMTKNNSLRGSVNRNFALLGDPTMRLAYTDYSVSLVQQSDVMDTLRALGTYRFEGTVGGLDGTVNTGFNGTVSINVFDKPVDQRTLGDESQPITYEVRSSSLFRGEASVTNGRFSFEMVVPKNISYQFGRGKISLYAQAEDGLTDANGAITEVIVGGSTTSPITDTEPPKVDVFINSEDFVNGQKVGQNPLLLMKLSDENGVSLSKTGIGQQMTATIDNDITVVLSDFYVADIDTYQSGTVRYPLGSLLEGRHTITTKVWDTYNNATEKTVEFYVGGGSNIEINNLKNFPNPMRDYTVFSFGYDRPGEGVDIELTIISLNGEVVYRQQFKIDETEPVVDSLEWDGRYPNGSQVINGIYIYKLLVRSNSDGTKSEAYEKLIIAN